MLQLIYLGLNAARSGFLVCLLLHLVHRGAKPGGAKRLPPES